MPAPPSKPVLLIEDDLLTAEVLTLALELEGFQVCHALEGQQALELLRSREAPGVIFMDLGMAGMDGVQFHRIQREDPLLSHIHVVVMSGDSNMESRIPPHANVSYLQKPVSLDQLIELAGRYCA